MSLNPGGAANYSWNYSKPDKPGYSTQLVGTVLAIQEVQKMGFTTTGKPGAPEFWPDGNPKMNIRMALATEQGELKAFTFQPASKEARMGQKKSVHMDLFHLTGDTDMMNLVGKTICISTQEGHYGQGNPRPWFVQLVDAGPFQLSQPLPPEFKLPQVLANNAVSGGQVQAPQAQQQSAYQQQPQPQQPQPQYQQPAQFHASQQPQYMPYMQQQQPQYQQPVQQPMYQQPAPQYPQGMDPQVAQAMASQVFGGPVTVEQVPPQQPVDPVGSGYVYDDDPDMPF